MAKREKKILVKGVTGEEMEQAFADYAMADAKIEEIEGLMDAEMARIRDQYIGELTALRGKKERCFEILQAFSVEHPRLFSKKRSYDCAYGTIGFRTGNPKLKIIKGFTWAASLNRLKELLPEYIRVTEEPAKDRLLADRKSEEVRKAMLKCGITVAQEVAFYVELKKRCGRKAADA